MSDTNAAREALADLIESTGTEWEFEFNADGISIKPLADYLANAILASGYITTAEADLRVAEMRERAADAAKGIVAANTAKRQWAEALGASESHNAILSLPITKEGGTQC